MPLLRSCPSFLSGIQLKSARGSNRLRSFRPKGIQCCVIFTDCSSTGSSFRILSPRIQKLGQGPGASVETSILPAMTSITQVRSHSGHSHSHQHDNTYLTSTNRKDAGVRITRIGLYVNLGMAVSKGIGGYYFNSQALVADAFHAMTDLVSDFMTLATISVALKPPNARYPNGFGKVESFGSLVVSGLLLGGGVLMGQHACGALYHQFFVDTAAAAAAASHDAGIFGHSHSHDAAHLIPNINAAWLAAGSIIVKEYLYRATMKIALERKSSVLKSNAVHHRVDSLTSIVALLAIGGSHLFNGVTWLDPVGGLIVSLMVIKAGIENTVSAIFELVDTGVDEEIKNSVCRAANKVLSETTFQTISESFSGSDVEVLDIQGIKAGQNYLIEVELAVPGHWTVQQMRQVENTVRIQIGSNVRGIRKVRIKFVEKELEKPDFSEEFIAADLNTRITPELENEVIHHDHSKSRNINEKVRKGL